MNIHALERDPVGLSAEETADARRQLAKTIADVFMLANKAHGLSLVVGITADQHHTLVKAAVCLNTITQEWRESWT